MLSVRGVFQNGVARPIQPVEASDGQQVIITFLDEAVAAPALLEAPVLVDEGGILVVVAELLWMRTLLTSHLLQTRQPGTS